MTSDLEHIARICSAVGMVFRHFNLFPHLTELEHCALALVWVRKLPRREAEPEVFFRNPRSERTRLFLSRILS